MHRIALTAFALGLLLSTPIFATGVEVIEGQVSINRGDGYQPLVDWAPASPGDLVMASPNGSGKITYADGCVVAVNPGAVVAIAEQSPCTTGRFGSKPGYLIGGVLVVGGIVGGVIALTGAGDDNDKKTGDKPASP